jgi:serine/threonine protein kinase
LRTVGRYELVEEAGRGGMAVVYLARQVDLERWVALKELSAFHASDSSWAQRFVLESRVAGSLAHPNIVTVYDFFEWQGTPYIAMEFAERGSLRPYVTVMNMAQIGGVLCDVLAGLEHAHQRGIIHRDVKPENILVTADGQVKVADFGVAKATSLMTQAAFRTATGITVGTPGYMAPEQAMATDLGPWTDLYSVGCIAYELSIGSPPFADSADGLELLLRHVHEPIPSVRAINPDIDVRISAWIDALLVKDPAARIRSAELAQDTLETILISAIGPRWRRDARLLELESPNRTSGAGRVSRPADKWAVSREQTPPTAQTPPSIAARLVTPPPPPAAPEGAESPAQPIPGPFTPPPQPALSEASSPSLDRPSDEGSTATATERAAPDVPAASTIRQRHTRRAPRWATLVVLISLTVVGIITIVAPFRPSTSPARLRILSNVAVAPWNAQQLNVYVVGTDRHLYSTTWPVPAHGGWVDHGGSYTGTPALSPGGGVWVIGTNGHLYIAAFQGDEGVDRVDLGGSYTGSPVVVRRKTQVDVFTVGEDHHLYHSVYHFPIPGGSVVTESLGGSVAGSPAAASLTSHRLDVFAIGTDSHLYHAAWNGSRHNRLKADTSGAYTGSPAAASWSKHRIEVFATDSSGHMVELYTTGRGLHGAYGLGDQTFTGSPAVAVANLFGLHALDLFAIGTDRQLYESLVYGRGVYDWHPHGGSLIGSPTATRQSQHRVDAFAVTTDRRLFHIARTNRTNGPASQITLR